MANFSVNQVRQFYVVLPGTNGGYQTSVATTSPAGTIGAVKKIEDILGDQLFFQYKGADADTVLRSDLIPIKNITYAKAINAFDMATVLKKVEITLSTDAADNGAPISGKDYVLGINFKNFFSSGDASQYYKDAAVHVTSAVNSASAFYKAMVKELNACFSREDGASATSNPYLKFSIKYSGGTYEETDSSFANATATAIVIEEKAQAWKLGTMKARRIMFDVLPGTIINNGDEVIWGTATDATPAKYVEDSTSQATPKPLIPNSAVVVGTNAIGNGQSIADLEWFCAGERGDQYRMKGWPNYVHTDYLIGTAGAAQQYHVLEIHYAFTDTGVNSYRTEKEITVVAPATSAGKTALNSFIGAINTASGLSIATLS